MFALQLYDLVFKYQSWPNLKRKLYSCKAIVYFKNTTSVIQPISLADFFKITASCRWRREFNHKIIIWIIIIIIVYCHTSFFLVLLFSMR
jgi:hypothetical protein